MFLLTSSRGTLFEKERGVRPSPSRQQRGDYDADHNGDFLFQYLLAARRTLSITLILIASIIVATTLAMIVHELGHFFAARTCKVACSELGLGFGPKLLGFRVGNTRLNLRALPLGSFVRLDGTALKARPVQQQLFVHLGGILFNIIAGLATYGTVFGWVNVLLAAGNLLPLYQHDGWKCGLVFMRWLLQRNSQPVERVFTFSGGFVSVAIVAAIIQFLS
jgi:membrane-associated protease RseP (regulator of RpoE activity)